MDPRARAYIARRLAEGRSRRGASRALKRHLSDVVYQQLRRDAQIVTRNLETPMHANEEVRLT